MVINCTVFDKVSCIHYRISNLKVTLIQSGSKLIRTSSQCTVLSALQDHPISSFGQEFLLYPCKQGDGPPDWGELLSYHDTTCDTAFWSPRSICAFVDFIGMLLWKQFLNLWRSLTSATGTLTNFCNWLLLFTKSTTVIRSPVPRS